MGKAHVASVSLLALLVLLAGCVGGGGGTGDAGVSPEELRDGFVGSGSNVSSYAYEGETTFEFSPVSGTGTRIQTTKTDGIIDYENGKLRVKIVSSRGTPGNMNTTSETTEYVVNGTTYVRTVRYSRNGTKTAVRDTENPSEANRTWESRDEITFYKGLLRNASVSMAGGEQETVNGTEAYVLSVELNESERTDFLTGELSDPPEFLNQLRMEEFNTTVWISEEESRLIRAETEATAVAPDVPVGNRRMDIRVEISFVDKFSYDEPVEIELPEGARDDAT